MQVFTGRFMVIFLTVAYRRGSKTEQVLQDENHDRLWPAWRLNPWGGLCAVVLLEYVMADMLA